MPQSAVKAPIKEAVLYKKSLELIKWQAIFAMAPVFLCFFYAGSAAGVAALYGISICLLANSVFAWLLFRHQGALAAKKIVSAFYIGELIKMVITIIMFALAVVVFKLLFLPLIVSYIICQLVWYICPLMMKIR